MQALCRGDQATTQQAYCALNPTLLFAKMRIWFVYCFLKPHSSMTFKEENDLTGKNGSCLVRAEEFAILSFISWLL